MDEMKWKEFLQDNRMFTWYPSAGSYEQTLPMVLSGTKLKTYLNPSMVLR